MSEHRTGLKANQQNSGPEHDLAALQSSVDHRIGVLFWHAAPRHNELVDFIERLRAIPDTPEKSYIFMALAKRGNDHGLVDDALATAQGVEGEAVKPHLYLHCSDAYLELEQPQRAAVAAGLIPASSEAIQGKKYGALLKAAKEAVLGGHGADARDIVAMMPSSKAETFKRWLGLARTKSGRKHRAGKVVADVLKGSEPTDSLTPQRFTSLIRPGTAYVRQVPTEVIPEAVQRPEIAAGEDWSVLDSSLPEISNDMRATLQEGVGHLVDDLKKPWRFLQEEGEIVRFEDDIRQREFGLEQMEFHDQRDATVVMLILRGNTFTGSIDNNTFELSPLHGENLPAGKAELVQYLVLAELRNLRCTKDKLSPYETTSSESTTGVLRRRDTFVELPLGQEFSARAVGLARTRRGYNLAARNDEHQAAGGQGEITYRSAVKKPGAPEEPTIHIRR